MNVARWAGMLAAALALGCAGQQAETKTTAAQPRDTDRGGGANATAANEQAPSQRPSSGAGTQSPHPVATNPDDPQYSGDRHQGEIARPGAEGRPGVQGEGAGATAGAAGAAAAAAGEVKELPEVYGQVKGISGNELEVEPAYGDSVKLKLNGQSMAGDRQASAAALEEGDEVRVSYDEQGGDKVAIDVQKDPPASTVRQMLTPGMSDSSDTHRSATTGGTSGSETGTSTGSSTTTPAPAGTTGNR